MSFADGVPGKSSTDGFRSYEVYQRQRVHESTAKINPRELISDEFCEDPYPMFGVLRENYPCFRDWVSNCFWVTRYDDVTSILVDNANFETRPRRWFMGLAGFGRDLSAELPVLVAEENCFDQQAPLVLETILDDLEVRGSADLATDYAMRFSLELLTKFLDLPPDLVNPFLNSYWRLMRGTSWRPEIVADAAGAAMELDNLVAPILNNRKTSVSADLISVIASGGGTSADLVATLIENDYLSLFGGLANLMRNLLVTSGALEQVRADPRKIKLAYLESMRLFNPVLIGKRFARHEVERFGQLLPEGALVNCCAGAANRDPRVFAAPDEYQVPRKDLCKREPRGSYRADGLPSGISVGLGPPSRYPAVPEDRPRSKYAITRELSVMAIEALLLRFDNIRLSSSESPGITSQSLGEPHLCWSLPVAWS